MTDSVPQDINDLAISPLSPQTLASCSVDYSIRIWNLDPKHKKQPCAAILSGEGHRQPILAIVRQDRRFYTAVHLVLTADSAFTRMANTYFQVDKIR